MSGYRGSNGRTDNQSSRIWELGLKGQEAAGAADDARKKSQIISRQMLEDAFLQPDRLAATIRDTVQKVNLVDHKRYKEAVLGTGTEARPSNQEALATSGKQNLFKDHMEKFIQTNFETQEKWGEYLRGYSNTQRKEIMDFMHNTFVNGGAIEDVFKRYPIKKGGQHLRNPSDPSPAPAPGPAQPPKPRGTSLGPTGKAFKDGQKDTKKGGASGSWGAPPAKPAPKKGADRKPQSEEEAEIGRLFGLDEIEAGMTPELGAGPEEQERYIAAAPKKKTAISFDDLEVKGDKPGAPIGAEHLVSPPPPPPERPKEEPLPPNPIIQRPMEIGPDGLDISDPASRWQYYRANIPQALSEAEVDMAKAYIQGEALAAKVLGEAGVKNKLGEGGLANTMVDNAGDAANKARDNENKAITQMFNITVDGNKPMRPQGARGGGGGGGGLTFGEQLDKKAWDKFDKDVQGLMMLGGPGSPAANARAQAIVNGFGEPLSRERAARKLRSLKYKVSEENVGASEPKGGLRPSNGAGGGEIRYKTINGVRVPYKRVNGQWVKQ